MRPSRKENIKQKLLLPFSLTDVKLDVGLYLALLITTEQKLLGAPNYRVLLIY